MTEERWLACLTARPLLNHIRDGASDRKLRLFACACCRTWPHIMVHDHLTALVSVMEQFADGIELQRDLPIYPRDHFAALIRGIKSGNAFSAACKVIQLLAPSRYCSEVRDIFGNPFRPVAFSPDWRTDTTLALARQMYESRDFGAMPILADALQDAGCENDDILAHCRDANATHVRGCWVVDLVLGKE